MTDKHSTFKHVHSATKLFIANVVKQQTLKKHSALKAKRYLKTNKNNNTNRYKPTTTF